jgi:hypothetical protein
MGSDSPKKEVSMFVREERLSALSWGLSICAIVVAASMIVPSAAFAKAPVPEGRTYFTMIIGIGNTPYQVEAACMKFNATEMCADDGDCFSWSRTEAGNQTRLQTAFELNGFVDNDDGTPVEVAGFGRADGRGRRSSFGGVARARAENPETGEMVRLNIAISGREVPLKKCRQLVDDFEAAMNAADN